MVRSLDYQESLFWTLAWYRAAFRLLGWLDRGGSQAEWRAAAASWWSWVAGWCACARGSPEVVERADDRAGRAQLMIDPDRKRPAMLDIGRPGRR
jgi:hypothetical protein